MKRIIRFLIVIVSSFALTQISIAQWVQTNTGLTSNPVQAIAVIGSNLFAGTWGNGVLLSTNNGASWTQTSLDSMDISAFAASGTNIFAGTWGGESFSLN